MILENKTYDILKWFAQVFIPALLTFYGIVGATFHIPYTQEVLTVGAAFDTFLGALLGLSASNYNKQVEDTFPQGELYFDEGDEDDGK